MLSTETTGDVLVVRLTEKRLDAGKAPLFKERIGSLIEDGASRLVLDLRDVEFIDSSGLGVIVSCLKRLGPAGNLAIAGASSPVKRLFTLTRMDRVFSMHDTPEAAVASLTS
ncbi:STAS domain-containing protein [Devosia sp. RR2S18]|uniref:STAS domain-containing protein n=1 Tax=Devosia rhizosphaerae TaxID=3049774 RepID=UPI002540E854|nr:STAS domain-containing protein [Devosia sp. RR2S18]WIJ23779.1 STAS domain-containing protein [Devosia sp. RR2S18]